MSIESPKNGTDIFWRRFTPVRLTVGTDNYRAVCGAIGIGLVIFGGMVKVPNKLLSTEYQEIIKIEKGKLLNENVNRPVFIKTFEKLCSMLTSDLGLIPPHCTVRSRIKILTNKIEEAKERTNLV